MRATILAVFTLFIGACAGNTPAEARFTCDVSSTDAYRCTEYVSGWTGGSARSLCDPDTAFSTTAEGCPSFGRTGRCVVTLEGVAIIYSYAIVTDTLAEDCAALGGDYTAFF